ncbi:MAG: polysaccharide deacetylase family protein [Ferruginibacter sp.]
MQYICKFIFNEQLGITHSITIDLESFKKHDGPKINYSDIIINDALNMEAHSLLFEENTKEQKINIFTNGYKAFFETLSADFPFDIFAASFYLVTRYEEYLPHKIDIYNRYAHENSLAYKEGFLNQPLVNIWLGDFARVIEKKFSGITFAFPAFSFLPTYDVDIAYSFKHKGLLRNLGGFIKNPSRDRLAVLSRFKKDPFDSYDFMDDLHRRNKLAPIYFFLVATSGSMYDKNISPYSNAMWQLIKQHSKKYAIGLHPSWRSNKNLSVLQKEKKVLEAAADTAVKDSRQHYIKFSMPSTFENLIEAGIRNDYSMGYGSINGFRASVASPFYWYNLRTEKITTLKIHPFCFMDANSFYEQKQDTAETYDELMYYLDTCKKVNGTFISIFHNNFLGTDKEFVGWSDMYVSFISQVLK